MNALPTITAAADLVAEVCRPGLPQAVQDDLRAALRHLARAEGYLGRNPPPAMCDFCQDTRIKTFTDGGTYCLNCGSIRKPEDISPSFSKP